MTPKPDDSMRAPHSSSAAAFARAGEDLLPLRSGLEAALETFDQCAVVVAPNQEICLANGAARAALEVWASEAEERAASESAGPAPFSSLQHLSLDLANRVELDPVSPHRAEVVLGAAVLEVTVRPLRDSSNRVVGSVVSWEDRSEAHAHRAQFDAIVRRLSDTGRELTDGAEGLLDLGLKASLSADDTHDRARKVATAGQQVSHGMQQAASVAADLFKKTSDIAAETAELLRLAEVADQDVDETSALLERLTLGLQQVGALATSLSTVASQSKVLALNAAIEAERARVRSRGFGSLVEEMNALAGDTSRETRAAVTLAGSLERDLGLCGQALARLGDAVARMEQRQGAIWRTVQAQTTSIQALEESVALAAQSTAGIVSDAQRLSEATHASKGSIASSVSSSVVLYDRLGSLLEELQVLLAVRPAVR